MSTRVYQQVLSKIERDQLIPTLPTLLKVALVFGVGLEHFFIDSSEKPTVAVVRKKDRLRLPDRPGDESPSYFFESLDFPVTDRIIYVISGQLAVDIDGDDTTLNDGDSMYFDAVFPHSYRRHGPAACSAIVVVTF